MGMRARLAASFQGSTSSRDKCGNGAQRRAILVIAKGREQLAAEKRGERNMGHVIAKSFIARVCANKASAAEIQSGPPSTAPTLDGCSEP